MVVPVIDFSKLDGAERAETMAQIADGCQNWGFFQLVNHGIPLELLDRVKKVCSESYRLREAAFRSSEPVQTLERLVDAERRGEAVAPVDDMDWEDIFYLPDAIVVNTGDQVEVLSNGRYRSAWHRVLPMRNGNRRSIASFYNPAFEAAISPAVGEGAAAAYPDYVFGDYMDVYNKQKFDAKEPRFEAVKAPKAA
ncbi:unnamed protein product [Triticum turgidum subsp. durum]|uniref:Uncharacterized protein n=1 Tax=Triticum turgidum subsp. durum TaxID=4567 RepID=A0A9R0QNJ2_TRITD|nr:unnamed protein product [Triticum turgidum subsp. durum]